MKTGYCKLGLYLLLLTAFLLCSVVHSLSIGVVDISWKEIVQVLYGFLIDKNMLVTLENPVAADIILDLRLPRILMAVIAGGALALGGVVMQAVIRNPLADPYILGVSSGAALGATASIILGAFSIFGVYGVSAGAFIGALAVTFTVFALTFSVSGSQSITKLILAGTALNAICGSCTSMIVYLAKDVEGIRDASFWIMGSMGRTTWEMLPLGCILFCATSLFFATQFRSLNASLLGDEAAVTLGIDVAGKRKLYLVLVALMVSSVVASVGIIGFVGLVVPHIVRLLLGSDHTRLLPVSVLLGAIYLVWCDVFARTALMNAEIPIGIVTSLIGGPFFLYLMMFRKYGYGDR
ncbi:MAG: iron ABC transporter permease [Acidaminococcaceae bacterium]|nr:iron ABC transporter permease [Acidaminococcaceae bacterium]